MPTTLEIAKRLVQLCNEDKSMKAVEELYSPDIVSVEPISMGNSPQSQKGIQAIRDKHEWWYANHTVHSGKATGPWPHGDRFIVHFKYEVTPNTGPMANKKMTIDESALYTVKDGKITQEEFFYDMGG
jgi:ketosteroid isomerase-like protein